MARIPGGLKLQSLILVVTRFWRRRPAIHQGGQLSLFRGRLDRWSLTPTGTPLRAPGVSRDQPMQNRTTKWHGSTHVRIHMLHGSTHTRMDMLHITAGRETGTAQAAGITNLPEISFVDCARRHVLPRCKGLLLLKTLGCMIRDMEPLQGATGGGVSGGGLM